jgi:hypothetical protein
MTTNSPRELRLVPPVPTAVVRVPSASLACPEHPAFEADYCPACGTARQIGGTR